MEIQAVRALIAITGFLFALLFAVLTMWFIDKEDWDIETKVGIKVAIATMIFSIMMFTPAISMEGGFVNFGVVAIPSAKLVADALTMAFMASSLRDLIEDEMEKN